MARGFNSKFAWWYLSQKQKQALKEERQSKHRFGGSSKPRYWPQQEVGMAEVGIQPQYYIKRTQAAVRAEVAMRLRSAFL